MDFYGLGLSSRRQNSNAPGPTTPIPITTRYGPPGASFERKFCLREDKIQSDGRHIDCDEEILARLDRLRENRHISAYFCFFRTFSGSSLVPVYFPKASLEESPTVAPDDFFQRKRFCLREDKKFDSLSQAVE